MKTWTNEEATHLLNLPKMLVENDRLISRTEINPGVPFAFRHEACSQDDMAFSFLIDVKQSAKNSLKMDLHFQEQEHILHLLRVDFFGQHQNPAALNEFVPDFIQPFVGKWFGYDDHHIHYFVQGYNPLAWAIPLTADVFPVKQVVGFESMTAAFLAFLERVNITTEVNVRQQTRLES